MAFRILVTAPRTGLPGALTPYTVEVKVAFATRAEAQAAIDSKVTTPRFRQIMNDIPPWRTGGPRDTGDLTRATWEIVDEASVQYGQFIRDVET